MPELGEETLQVCYKGADIAVHTLEKVFAAVLREIEKNRAAQPQRDGLQSIQTRDAQNKELVSVELDRKDAKQVANELKGYGVDFSIMRNKEGTAHTLFFRAKDSAAIERALHQYLEKAHRELEKAPGRNANEKQPIFTGKSLQEDMQKAKEAVTARNAERAKTRPPKMPDRGRDR